MVRWRMPPTDLVLTAAERTELERLARSRRDRMDHVTRAQGILMLADGATYAEVHRRLGWSSRTTATWKIRFLTERLAGLRGRHRGSKPTTLTPALEARESDVMRRILGASDHARLVVGRQLDANERE